jgi:hypothetical protein
MNVTAPPRRPCCKRDLLPPLWPLSPMPVPRMRKIRPRNVGGGVLSQNDFKIMVRSNDYNANGNLNI